MTRRYRTSEDYPLHAAALIDGFTRGRTIVENAQATGLKPSQISHWLRADSPSAYAELRAAYKRGQRLRKQRIRQKQTLLGRQVGKRNRLAARCPEGSGAQCGGTD